MPTTPNITSSILALDVGDKRVGVARASLAARIPEPLTTLQQGETFFDELQQIIKTENTSVLVVGLPRGLSGQETPQTQITRDFIATLQKHSNLPVQLQDEALTSEKARNELQARRKQHARADVDALAATYILEDFLAEHPLENTELVS